LVSNLNYLKNSPALSPKEKSKVLIIGSNASALELLYNLKNYPELRFFSPEYYVISPGRFPHRITIGPGGERFELANLNSLRQKKRFTAINIWEAVKKDTESAENAGVNVADIINDTSVTIIDLLNKLSYNQQKAFVYEAGVEIGKLQRRAGHEYLNVVQELSEQDKLRFIPGKFEKALQTAEGLVFEYKNLQGQTVQFDTAVQVIVNCGGFEDLSENSVSSLIRNLIANRVCKTNNSRRGFRVNEKFEARKNFFVIGPLLAGNINKKLRVWHAESCSRIFSLSQQLAVNLLEEN
jgi:uncharacterized NAD(P)/FAD-binding protein YdhS